MNVQCLNDFITLQRGFDLPASTRKKGTVPVVASRAINGFHSEAKVKGPGVVIGRSGSIGGGQYIVEDFWPLNTTLWVKDFKGHNVRYVYYLLKSIDFSRFNAGAGVPTLNRNHLSGIKVKVLSGAHEDEIVKILAKYDDLIENNKRRIALLEESARQLYKEWFVRFRFPGHEHVKIVDGVPEGWKNKEIGELSSYLSRGMTPKYDEEGEYTVINQKCIRNRLLSLGLTRRQSKEVKEEKLVRAGDVLINSTGVGTLGRVAQCWLDVEKCTVDTHVTIVRPKVEVSAMWFGYCLMELESVFEGMGQGATNQKELRRDLVASMRVLVPSVRLQSTFEEYAYKCSKQIVLLDEENARLSKARDILLPKLMSGELAV